MTRLRARFRRRVASDFTLDVELDLDLGGATPLAALFGPSGSGKTTTLRILAGLERPDSGSIAVGESVLDDDTRTPAVRVPPERRAVGLVPQDALLFPHLDVRGNLGYGQRRSAGRAGPALDRVVDVLGLGDLLPRATPSLSGGERQRVAIGRALLAAPTLLLLDEPVSALDHAARWRVLGLIERVVTEFRVPSLYVSHHRSEVLRLCPTAALMDAGRVVASGAAADVLPADADGAAVWNVFQVRGGGGRDATVAGSHVVLPRDVPADRSVWCRVSSASIVLRRESETAATTSARNELRGRVLAVTPLGDRVRVTVDAGIALQVDVTPAAVAELALATGADVACVFKTYGIELLD